jgi:hypothetical protein
MYNRNERYIFPFLMIWILVAFNFLSKSFAIEKGLTIAFIHTEGANTDMLIYAFPVQGWYLISLPITVANNNVNDLFPSAIGAFSFNYDIYEYVPITTIQTGEGYWLAVNEPSMAMGNAYFHTKCRNRGSMFIEKQTAKI